MVNIKCYRSMVDGRWSMALFLSAVFLFSSFADCYAQEKKEQAQEEKYYWDFGKVKEGSEIKHEFIFKNESKVVLNIKDINTSCGCTVSVVKQKILKPNESTTIEVTFKSKGYDGEVKQYVYMNTDNLDNPVIRFIIRALVEK